MGRDLRGDLESRPRRNETSVTAVTAVCAPPPSLGANIDEELESVILGCLEKEPAKRPARASDVAESLRRYRSRLRDSDRERPLTALTLTTPRPVLAPFVGRTKEFAELQRRLNAALAGESQFVVVGGEQGIGKTRLLDELEKLASARQSRFRGSAGEVLGRLCWSA